MTTTPSEDHAAREAEIRQRIAAEVNGRIDRWRRVAQWNLPWFQANTVVDGLREALRIIERGGAQPEEE